MRSTLRLAPSLLISFALAFGPCAAWADPVDDFIQLRMEASQAALMNLSPTLNGKLSGQLDAFYKKNRGFLESKDGALIKQDLVKLRNVLVMKAKFDECFKGLKSKGEYEKRILSLAEQVAPDDFDCDPGQFASLNQTLGNISNALDPSVAAAFETRLTTTIQDSSGVNIADMMYRIYENGPTSLSKQGMSNSQIADRAAAQACSQCSATDRQRVKARALQHLNQISGLAPRQNLEDVGRSLETRINQLNTSLRLKTSNKTEAEQNLKSYQKDYFNLTSSGTGLLLNSNLIKRSMGEVRTMDDIKESSGSYSFSPHGQPNLGRLVLKQSLDQYYSEMRQLSSTTAHRRRTLAQLNKRAPNPAEFGQIKESLKDAIVNNTPHIAYTLARNPEYAPLVCNLIKELDQEDARKQAQSQFADKVLMGAAIAGGVALAATGVGAVAGAGLIGTAATSLAVTSGAVATVASLPEVPYYAAQLGTSLNKSERMKTAARQGTLDTQGVLEARQATQAVNDAAFNLSTAIGANGVGFAAGYLRAAGKLGGAAKGAEAGAIEKVSANLQAGGLKSGDVAKIQASLESHLGKEEASDFMGEFYAGLKDLPADMQASEMKALREASQDGNRLRQFIDERRGAINSCALP